MTYTRRRPSNYHKHRSRNDFQRNQNFSHGRRRGGKESRIELSQLVKKAEVTPTRATYVPQHTFADFALDKALLQNITNHGYTSPTPIQDQAIPQLLVGKDVVGIANTGTGKTAAFLIPLINKIINNVSETVLIVAPTRELAVQIQDVCKAFTRGMPIYSVLCIGGVGMAKQVRGLQKNPQIVIGTPGRLKDLSNQRKLNFSLFTTIVLDEVDRMLDMGFINDVKFMVSRLPQDRQSLFFSATISSAIRGVMESFLKDPVTISVKSRETAENVDQDIIRIGGRQKIDVLHDLLVQDTFQKVIVFGRTKWGIEKLSKALEERGFRVAAIHGNKNQNQRQRALDAFRKDRIQALLATDVASRGLDIENVTHVINYDLPESYEDYVHRIGRTGRAEKKGIALTFID